MSNSPKNREQNTVIALTPTQQDPYAAKPTDFKIEDRGPGQCGDTKAERSALLAESDADQKTKLGQPIADGNKVPARRISEGMKPVR
jgi:hypothetical protein